MEKYSLPNDVIVFGVRVKSFPLGIGEAFDTLFKSLPDKEARSYFGLSELSNDGTIQYYAVAEEIISGEGEKYRGERFVLEKGEYLTQSLMEWRKHTGLIKDIFGELLKDDRIDRTKPCVEWYKNEEEMLCMIKTKLN